MEDRVTAQQEALHAEYVTMRTQLTPNIKALFANSFAGAAKCFRNPGSREESTRCSDMHLKKISDLFSRSQVLLEETQRKFDGCVAKCSDKTGRDFDNCTEECKQAGFTDIKEIRREIERLSKR